MPPKKRFTRETIIETAFEIALSEGLNCITIRNVAERLGSSIAPIYVNFENIDELIAIVIERINQSAQQMLMTPHSPKPFLSMGIASLKFAREYPLFFRDVILNNSSSAKELPIDTSFLMELQKKDSELEGFNEEELREILLKMQIFQLGLSVMDMNGKLPSDWREEQLIALLESAGSDVIKAARQRKEGVTHEDHIPGGRER